MGAFHAYDIRGVWGKDWNLDIAYKVGYFIPILLKTNKVLLGRDCRVSSDEIHDAVIRGINDAGADVYDIGLSSTPMVYFGTANYGFDASVQRMRQRLLQAEGELDALERQSRRVTRALENVDDIKGPE